MKKFLAVTVAILFAMSADYARADIIFSIDRNNAAAGNTLNLLEGQSGSMFVFISTEAGQTFNGMGLDILSSDPAVLQATAYNVANPSGRWLGIFPAMLGDLVTEANAFNIVGGLSTTGLTDFTLHSEIVFDATALGSTQLTFAENANLITAGLDSVANTISFGVGSVNVTAIPEPSSYAVLGVLGLTVGGYRRLRRRS